MPFSSIFGEEDDASAGSTRRSRQTTCQHAGTSQFFLVEYRMQQLVQLIRFAAHQSGLFVNHALMQHFHGDAHHSGTCTLTVTSLEEPELALLHGKFHVLHIVVVIFQFGLEFIKFLVDFRHGFFHRRIFGHTFCFRDTLQFGPALRTDLGNLLRSTDTGYYVFTLRIDQVFTIEQVFTGSGVA